MKILKFEAEWCGPCKTMDKALQEANLPYEKVDIAGDNEELVVKYKVRAVPTIIVTDDNGNQVERFSGIVPVENIAKTFNNGNKSM